MDHRMASHSLLCLVLVLCLLKYALAKPATVKEEQETLENNDLVRGLKKEEADQVDEVMVEVKKRIAKLHGFDIPDEKMITPLLGDIAMTLEQASNYLHSLEEEEIKKNVDTTGKGPKRLKRNSLDFERFSYTQWELPIEYSIRKKDFTIEDIKHIRKAFKLWEEATCIRFVEVDHRTPTKKAKKQRLEVKGDEEGCWSYVGRTKLERQPINLQPGGCTILIGIMAHEIGHAIGLYHIEDRPDRDDFIKVYYRNVLRYFRMDLDPQPATSVNYYGVPFDYASLMQLRRDSYSKDGSFTILPKDQNFLYTMGMLSEISFLDATIVNRAYKCDTNKEQCPNGGGDLQCYENGYPNPGFRKKCKTCKCPGGLSGDCTKPFENAPGCTPIMSELDVTGPGVLQSPNYEAGGPYNVGDSCSWILNAPEEYVFYFRFWEPKTEFGVYHYNVSGGICAHWVEINYHGNFSMPAKRHCGSENFLYNQKEKLLSTTNRALVYFSAESDELLDQDPALRRGFKLLYDIKRKNKPKSKNKKKSKNKSKDE